MKIIIYSVGKIKEKYFVSAIQEYTKRLSRYCKLEMIEVSDEKAPENLHLNDEIRIKNIEGEKLLSKISPDCFVVALDITSNMLTSEKLAEKLQDLQVNGKSTIGFVIGGSLGLSESIIKRSDYQLSFSKMTFPHQLMKVILLEQIYRSFRIINNEPYHK